MVGDYLKDGKWFCNGCGSCCAFIKPLIDKGLLPKHYLSSDDESCVNLEKDNTCKIYDDRPGVCRVDRNNYEDLELAQMCDVMERLRNAPNL